MGFEALHGRLTAQIRGKLRSGLATERGLARLTGISQPHLHNVLKGARKFSFEMADHVMERLQIGIWELQERPTAAAAGSESSEAPLVEGAIGPGRPFPDLGKWGGRMPFLRADLAGLELPVAARLGADPESRLFQGGDAALLEPAEGWTAAGYYALQAEGSGLVRWVERTDGGLRLRAERGGAETGCIAVADRNMLEVVRARVVWIGRYLRGEEA